MGLLKKNLPSNFLGIQGCGCDRSAPTASKRVVVMDQGDLGAVVGGPWRGTPCWGP